MVYSITQCFTYFSAIKPQDNSQKLRTNNYLDISDKRDTSSYSPNTNNTCYHDNNTCTCPNKEDLRSKDSGFGTSSAMSNMASSILPPLSGCYLMPSIHTMLKYATLIPVWEVGCCNYFLTFKLYHEELNCGRIIAIIRKIFC